MIEPTNVRTAEALERIATALEQLALANIKETPTSVDPPWPVQPPVPETQELPPVAPQFTFKPVAECPVHHQPWKTVPAGVSKRTGQPYAAFQACPERDCNQRPPA